MINVQLEAIYFIQLFIFIRVLFLAREEINSLKLFEELLLLLHLFTAHYLTNRDLEWLKAADV